MPQYVIISPVRDEERHIERTLLSVVSQTVLPTEWIIVDDGSTDHTTSIIARYAAKHSFIRLVHHSDRGQRVPGTGVMEAFHYGYNRLQSPDWMFIAKLDGDVHLEPDYFQRCFEHFAEDPNLGICGGTMYCPRNGRLTEERHPLFHVRGPIKLYRRSCWDTIGGLVVAPGWDTVDEVQANRLGWTTRSIRNLKVIHQRPTGAEQGWWRDGIKMGQAAYVSGYHPLFMCAKCVRRLVQRPYVFCAIAHAYGFVSGYFSQLTPVSDPAYIRYIRSQQMRRLLSLDSIWK